MINLSLFHLNTFLSFSTLSYLSFEPLFLFVWPRFIPNLFSPFTCFHSRSPSLHFLLLPPPRFLLYLPATPSFSTLPSLISPILPIFLSLYFPFLTISLPASASSSPLAKPFLDSECEAATLHTQVLLASFPFSWVSSSGQAIATRSVQVKKWMKKPRGKSGTA